MYEHLIKGKVSGGESAEAISADHPWHGPYVHLAYTDTVTGKAYEHWVPAVTVGAIEVWLKQPKTITPEQRTRAFFHNHLFSKLGTNGWDITNPRDMLDAIAAEIRAAEEAARNEALLGGLQYGQRAPQ